MDENAIEFLKNLVGSDLNKKIIEIMANHNMSSDDKIAILLEFMEGSE